MSSVVLALLSNASFLNALESDVDVVGVTLLSFLQDAKESPRIRHSDPKNAAVFFILINQVVCQPFFKRTRRQKLKNLFFDVI